MIREVPVHSPYAKLAIAILVNTIAMYFITYVTIDSLAHFHFNLNRVYRALLMAAPMVLVMLVVMMGMFGNRRLNVALFVIIPLVFIGLFAMVRTQALIGDAEFLRSMIPHHSGAILMCQQSALTDPEIIELCRQIVEAQRNEIAQMKEILERY